MSLAHQTEQHLCLGSGFYLTLLLPLIRYILWETGPRKTIPIKEVIAAAQTYGAGE
jgi:hypothetical protein